MARYTGFQSVLRSVLGKHVDEGFRLDVSDDHVLVLYHGDDRVAIFNQTTATATIIRDTCQEWLSHQI